MDDVITRPEAAALVKVAPATLRKWAAQNYGPPCFKVGSRSVRYRRSTVAAWLAEQEKASTASEIA